MCLRSWMATLGMVNIGLLEDFHEAYANLKLHLEGLAVEDNVIYIILLHERASCGRTRFEHI